MAAAAAMTLSLSPSSQALTQAAHRKLSLGQRPRSQRLAAHCLADGISVQANPPADGKVKLDVSITGVKTQKEFDKVLIELGKNAPLVPGFRVGKGGKNAKVPKTVMLRFLGKDNVEKFTITQLVSNTLAEYVEENGIKTVGKDAKLDQSEEELHEKFKPGEPMSFAAVLELLPDGDLVSSEQEEKEEEATQTTEPEPANA
eukprot:jgi/Chlat1/2949/Chrsp2S04683